MEKLLRQLKAHLATADPWILVYDNRGTFSRDVGNKIRICNMAAGASQLLGIPVRTATYVDYRGNVVMETRVERAELPELTARLENFMRHRLKFGT